MAKRNITRLGVRISVQALVILAAAMFGVFPSLSAGPPTPIAVAFDPKCPGQDEGCRLWTTFRTNHPYPYQGFAAGRLRGDRVLLVASEPPPDISHADAIELFKALFADRAPSVTTRKWYTGADGYAEDVLVMFDAPELKSDDILQEPSLRDRIALLGLAWYGTAYGTDVEPIQQGRLKRIGATAPNLHVTAAELRAWLTDPTIGWSPIEGEDSSANTWDNLASAHSLGAFRSADGTLVLLTFPKVLLNNPTELQKLKLVFRRYAVSSDATVGAVWRGSQVAFVGRGRTHSLAQIPPLRFETFAMLAAQREDALNQSYERTNGMAGKLIMADLVDWAPIYLSPALEDVEFGSLLDITDQMLKSWSEAGAVDYLYFDYPLRPDHFAFDKPLSQKVRELNGSKSVLFNWNTAGSAAVLDDGGQRLLIVHSLGSLPITYGSELESGGPVTTGHLHAFEESAYAYFSGLGDPNLARVVQYTLIYQTFRAVAADQSATVHPASLDGPSSPGAAVLIDATRHMLAELEAGTFEPPVSWPIPGGELVKIIQEARTKLASLRSHQPEISLDRLAILLADPRRADPVMPAQEQRLFAETKALLADARQLDVDRDAYNSRVDALMSRIRRDRLQPDDGTVARFQASVADLARQKAELDRRESELNAKATEDEALKEKLEANRKEVEAFRLAVHSMVTLSVDLRPVRSAYATANERDVNGWIRTPSFVTSRNSSNVALVGGHNLDARAIRLVPDRSVTDLQIVDRPDGRELLYNPDKVDVGDHAAELSRAVEHGDADVTKLKEIVATSNPPRVRTAALDMPPAGQVWTARLGAKGFASNDEFATELRAIKSKTVCCRILAKDANDVLYFTETNVKPPPTALVSTFGDTASFGNYMRSRGGLGDVIVFDQSSQHVEAMFAGLDMDPASPSRFDTLKAVARRLIGRSKPSDHLLLTDLRGRRGSIDVPRDRGAIEEGADRMVALAAKRTTGANVEELTSQQVADVVGGLEWNSSVDGAPRVVRVRLGGSATLDTVASFRTGDAAAQQQLLSSTVTRSVASSDANTKVLQLMLTIKLDLRALPSEQLNKLVLVVRDGGAKMQLTLAPIRPPASHD
jgi:hypothetical protein